jgi:type VI secretion system protein ImpJ
MTTYKLAPVRWELGQILLPEHFTTLHTSLLAELRARAAVAGLPAYGVAELSWHDKALEQGQLILQSLTAVLPSGLLINVPGNGTLEGLALKTTGLPKVRVYLHVLDTPASSIGNPLYASDPKTVRRQVLSLRLSTQPALERSIETLPLGAFQCEPDRRWVLQAEHCPPLLQVGPNPFLKQQLALLEKKLVEFHGRLVDDTKDTLLRGGYLSTISGCLREVCAVRSLVAEIPTGIHRHPYFLFDALRRLYFEICSFHEKPAEQPCLPYVHEGAGDSFAQLFGYLEKSLTALTAPRRHVELTLREGRFLLSAWPAELARAERVYLLVSRNQRHERITLDAVKLASPDRLELVHGATLRGIPFEAVSNPPSSRFFIEGMDFYELTLGDEWSHVLKSQGLSFYATGLLASPGVRVLLYFTTP